MKIYLCGPITGRPNQNIDQFRKREQHLTKLGYKVVVPHDLFKNVNTTNFEHSDYMRHCIKALMDCQMVAQLTDWHLSKGAKIETDLARRLDIPCKLAVLINTPPPQI